MHCHNTLQIVFDTQHTFRLRLKNGDWGTYKSLIIRENVAHQLHTNDSVQLIIYLDANSEISKSIKKRYLGDNDICSPGLGLFQITNTIELQKSIIRPQTFLLEKLITKILAFLSGRDQSIIIDQRVAQVEQTIALSHPYEVNSKTLAESVYLSESRLRSLFKEITGISLHQYFLFNKIRFATNQIMLGSTLKDAAVEAGFTDTSHLQKMMVKHFGVSPSRFIRENLINANIILDPSPLHFETTVY